MPDRLSYQGYLSDLAGAAIDADTVITFSIDNVEFSGTALWSDTQLVSIEQGLFSAELGGPGNPLPPGLFDTRCGSA